MSVYVICCCCSVAKSCLTLWPHELQHARLLYPSLSPWVCSHSCPLSQWCHLTISFSVTLFSCPRSFPASGSFPMNWLFTSGGQSIGTSASVLPMNTQGWFPLGLTDFISLLSKGLSRVLPSTAIQKYWCSVFIMVQLSHPYMTPGKTIAFIHLQNGLVWVCFNYWVLHILWIKSFNRDVVCK